jgi:hypothetical protein
MLDMATIKTVYQSGFSRIPVWHKDEHDIVGVFLVKDLVMIDPKEGNVPLLDFVQVFGKAAHRVWADATLGDVLKAFKGGNTHMALVFDVNNNGPVRCVPRSPIRLRLSILWCIGRPVLRAQGTRDDGRYCRGDPPRHD